MRNMMNKMFKKIFLVVFLLVPAAGLYGQGQPADTSSVIGKLIEKKEFTGEKGEKLFFVTIENPKKEKEVILIINDTKFWIGKKDAGIEAFKEGSNVTIDYKIDPNGGKVAIWVFMEDEKEEKENKDKTELKEEPPPAQEEEKREDNNE